MKKRSRRIAIIVMLLLIFSALPENCQEAEATPRVRYKITYKITYKLKKKYKKKIDLDIKNWSENSVSLQWNRIKKPGKGYAVFRNGVPIAHLGKKATHYTDTSVSAGTTYSYQIKTYQVKKVKKTKKAKKKKVKKYKYKKKSSICTITTPGLPRNEIYLQGIAFDSNDDIVLHVGETYKVNVVFIPSNTTSDRTLDWQSSIDDPSIATIDNNGVVTAHKEGSTYIIVHSAVFRSYFTGVRSIVVLPKEQPESSEPSQEGLYINVEKDTYDVPVGETVVVKATTNGDSGFTCYDDLDCFELLDRDTGYLPQTDDFYDHVTIKGVSPGTATIKFYLNDEHNSPVTKTVTINVIDAGEGS